MRWHICCLVCDLSSFNCANSFRESGIRTNVSHRTKQMSDGWPTRQEYQSCDTCTVRHQIRWKRIFFFCRRNESLPRTETHEMVANGVPDHYKIDGPGSTQLSLQWSAFLSPGLRVRHVYKKRQLECPIPKPLRSTESNLVTKLIWRTQTPFPSWISSADAIIPLLVLLHLALTTSESSIISSQ